MKAQKSTLTNLVAILNDGKFHDGISIGRSLNITRSAVWKAIKKLEDYGIQIESIKGKGYAMHEPLILLDKQIIKKKLTHKNIEIEIFESIDSTNTYLKSFLAETKNKKTRVCFTEQQTKGKGRLGREWYSPFGQNIYFSCLYSSYKDLSELAGLSLVVSLAVAKTLNSFTLPKPLLVKWPNDVIYDNKKISGNLNEVQAEANGMCAVIVGIGINVNMEQDAEQSIAQPWTSLRNIIGKYVDRNELGVLLINNLFNYLENFEQHGLSYFINEWNKADKLFNQQITLKHDNNKIGGIAKGINQHGHLLIEVDGVVKSFSSGDTTIVK